MYLAAFFGRCPFFAAELTVLERAEHLKRRKEIYEARYPEARATTGRELANKRWHASEKISPASFSEATATNLGVSPRTLLPQCSSRFTAM